MISTKLVVHCMGQREIQLVSAMRFSVSFSERQMKGENDCSE